MREERILRWLVCLEIVLVFAALWVGQLSGWLLPEPLSRWLQAEEAARGWSAAWLDYGVYGLLAGATVLSWIAILGLWRIGRAIYLATTVAWKVLGLLGGPAVLSPAEAALGSLISLTGGAILCLVYVSSLRDRFRRPAS
jgi:hypothetical protein